MPKRFAWCRQVTTLLAAIILAMLPFAVASPAHAIVNGLPSPFLGGQVQMWVSGNYVCAGSLISPRWVLTARHCIVDAGANHANTGILIGNLNTGVGEYHDILAFYLNPTADAALLELTAPTAQTNLVVGYGFEVPPLRSLMVIRAWGATNPNGIGNPAVLQAAIVTLTDTISTPGPAWGPPGAFLISNPAAGTQTSYGDSGAGVSYQGVICGVHVSGGAAGNAYVMSAVKTYYLANWIFQTSGVYGTGLCDLDQSRSAPPGGALRVMAIGGAETTGLSGGDAYRSYLYNDLSGAGLNPNFVGPDTSGSSLGNHLLGHPAYTISDLISQAQCEVYKYAPDVVTLEAGDQDMFSGSDYDAAPKNMDSLISTIQHISPNTVILVAPLVRSNGALAGPRIDQYNATVKTNVLQRKNAGQHIDWVDTTDLSITNNEDGTSNNNGPTALNESGNLKVAGAFNVALDDAVNAGWIPTSLPLHSDLCTTGGGVGKRSIVDLRVMPIGDSITEGYEDNNPNYNGNGYRYPLQQDIQGQGQTITFVGDQVDGIMTNPQNEGFSGQEIAYIAGKAVPAAASWRPNVALVLAGTNDYLHRDDTANAPSRLDSMISGLFQSAPDATLLVAGLPRSSDATLAGEFVTFNSAVQSLITTRQNAGQHIQYVSLDDLDPVADKTGSIHPNDAGYKKIGDDFSAAIEDVMNKGWVTAPVASTRTVGGTGGGGFGKGGTFGSAPGAGSWVPKGQIASGLNGAKGDRVIMADMDGDHRADYVMVHAATGALDLALNGGANASAAGGWLWNLRGTIAGGIAAGDTIHLADLNGDGKADYISVDPSTGALDVYLNGGPNASAPGGWVWFPVGTIAGGLAPGNTVQFGDLNGDGLADYVIVDPKTGAVQAFLNGGQNASAPHGWVWYSQPPIAAGDGSPRGSKVLFADLNHDGYDEYITVSATDGTVSAYLNHGVLPDQSTWWWIGLNQIAPGVGAPSLDLEVQYADIDGDGRADYLAINRHTGAINAFLNNGNDTSSVAGWLPRGVVLSTPLSITDNWWMADLDGNGQADFLRIDAKTGATTGQLNEGEGVGPAGSWAWGVKRTIAGGLGPLSSYVDLNGDGRADYVQVNPKTLAVTAYLNGGPATDGSWIWVPQGTIYNSNYAANTNIQFADINGDDKVDYLRVDDLAGTVDAALGSGQWTWSNIQSLVYLGGANAPHLEFADLDGDGEADLLVVNSNGSVNAWLNGGSTGSGWNWKNQGQIAAGVGTEGNFVQFADVNGDRRADFVSYGADGVTVFLNNGTDAKIRANIAPRTIPLQ